MTYSLLYSTDFTMLKKTDDQPRWNQEGKTIPKVKTVAKTGAQRSREYRARVRALENAIVARSQTSVENDASQPASQHDLGDVPVNIRPRSLLYDTKAIRKQETIIDKFSFKLMYTKYHRTRNSTIYYISYTVPY